MKKKLLLLLSFVMILVPVVGCDEDNNVFNDPNMTGDPQNPTPMLPCEALSLNLNFNIGVDVFAVYENSATDNVIHVYSSGSEVFIIVSNNDFAFGFSGPPTMDGLNCGLNVARADFDKDGMFDETATSFVSTCEVEGNGGVFTLFPNEAEINASSQMANAFQTFEATEMDIPCKEFQVISEQTFFEGLITELGYMPSM